MPMNNKTMRPQATAVARTMYFNSNGGDWSDVTNWYLDSNCSVTASKLPTAIDDVFVDGDVGVNSGGAIVVKNLTVGNYDSSVLALTMTVTGLSTFYGSSYYEGYNLNAKTLTTGSFSFLNTSYASSGGGGGTIIGSGSFSDTSHNRSTINGNCTFIDSSYADYASTINGNCTFADTSNSYGTITGDCTFADTSNSYGAITGNCTFSDSSYGVPGCLITGNCTFSDSSSLAGQVSGDCTFNNLSYNIGGVTGNAVFNNSSENKLGGCIFGNATLNDTSLQNGTVTGTTTDNR